MVKMKIIDVEKPYAKIMLDEVIRSYKNNSEYKRKLIDNYEERIEISEKYEREYLEAAEGKEIHKLESVNNLLGLYKNDMNYFYNQRVSSLKKLLEKDEMCPICENVTPTTLDHVLPKQMFVQYTLIPINIVPMCSSCNKEKSNYVGKNYTETPLHPYFENINFKEYVVGRIQKDSKKAPIELVIDPDLLATSVAKKHAHNYKYIFKLYKDYNSLIRMTYNNFINSIRDSYLTHNFVLNSIKSEYLKYRKQKYDRFNEEHIRYLFYKTMYENFDEELYNIIFDSTNDESNNLVELG